ncbi:unnamed protein product [Leptosia nina]|uniref:Uncharacterized protein n=1 Tax=Leptosia nina TaxID=320188 RepID=A0AAV1IVM2_9NEOP
MEIASKRNKISKIARGYRGGVLSGSELSDDDVCRRLGHVGRARVGRGAGARLGSVVVRDAPLVAAARPAPCVATRAPSQVYQVNVNSMGVTRTMGGRASVGWARAARRAGGRAAPAARAAAASGRAQLPSSRFRPARHASRAPRAPASPCPGDTTNCAGERLAGAPNADRAEPPDSKRTEGRSTFSIYRVFYLIFTFSILYRDDSVKILK